MTYEPTCSMVIKWDIGDNSLQRHPPPLPCEMACKILNNNVKKIVLPLQKCQGLYAQNAWQEPDGKLFFGRQQQRTQKCQKWTEMSTKLNPGVGCALEICKIYNRCLKRLCFIHCAISAAVKCCSTRFIFHQINEVVFVTDLISFHTR